MTARMLRFVIATTLGLANLVPGSAARADEFPDGVRDTLGPDFEAARGLERPRPSRPGDTIRRWNQIAIDASGLDHTPLSPGETRTFGEQLGPGRSSRAMAIVHVAIFEAVNSIFGGYQSYVGLRRAPFDTSFEAAVARAAHDALVAMFPSQTASFDAKLAEELAAIPWWRTHAKRNGVEQGRRAAGAILALRANDGAQHAEPRMGEDYVPGPEPGVWRQDPISLAPIALGAHWADVTPFTLLSADQFRVPPPPALDSAAYAEAFAEVAALGGDDVSTERTPEQTEIGIYWAYDGTPSLCAPPRLYNQIAVQIATLRRSGPVELARLLALVNVAMADAGIAIWESKYHYAFWRPVTGVRDADTDGNPNTPPDPSFSPLGAPASNLVGPNFTPPFPAYPSGHAGFGGALFQILRNFYGTDAIPFTFVSDELNGVTLDNEGNVRPLIPRSFDSLSHAEEENGQSRIYLGIHWAFDKTEGIEQGRRVADHVFANMFRPQRR